MIFLTGADYPKKVIPLINEAKTSIDIVSYDWRWYRDQVGHPVQQFNIALVQAKQRGVEVRAVLNSALLLPTLNKVGIKARRLNDKRTVHTKMIIVDHKILVIGSHNLTRNAFTTNLETSVVIELTADDKRVLQYFENLYTI